MKSRAENELEEFEKVFSALAHATRRQILVVLMARNGKMTAGDVVARFSCRWPTVSRHLKQLEDSGLVVAKKTGRERHYVLNKEKLQGVLGEWLKWFG